MMVSIELVTTAKVVFPMVEAGSSVWVLALLVTKIV